MKKQIVLLCENNQQFGLGVEELSVSKVVKRIIEDIWGKTPKVSICLSDYVPAEDQSEAMYVKSSIINAVFVVNMSNIQVPNKKLFVPGGKPN